MKKALKIIIYVIELILILATMYLIVWFMFENPKWQKGKEATEWLYNGLEYTDIDYDDVRFIKVIIEDNAVTYQYRLTYFDEKTRDGIIADFDIIGIAYGKKVEYDVFVSFEFSDCIWNQLNRNIYKSWESSQRYEKCIDFDIFVDSEVE